MINSIDFEALFDASPNPYLVLDRDLCIVAVNDAFLRMTSRERSSLVGKHPVSAFPVEDESFSGSARELAASMERVVASGRPDVLAVLHYPIRVRHGDQETVQDRYWSITHSPIFGGAVPGDGAEHDAALSSAREVCFVLQQVVDITRMQRIKSAQQVRQEAQAGQPMASGDAIELPVPEHGAEASLSSAAAFSEAIHTPIEIEEAGLLQRARVVQQANRTLGAEHTQLRTMFEAAPGFMCVLRGPTMVFEQANRAFLNLVGHREVAGKPLRWAVPELVSQGVIDQLETAYRTGQTMVGVDAPLKLRSGFGAVAGHGREYESLFLDYVIQPVTDSENRVIALFVQGSNVTAKNLAINALKRERADLEGLVRESIRALRDSEAERRHTEAALAHSQKMEAVGQLTGGVAHDFNNVLQIISGNLQLIQTEMGAGGIAEPAAIGQRLGAAVDAVGRGARLASQLLTFARRQPLTPRVVDPATLCAALIDMLPRLLGETIALETRIGQDLRHALVDANQLENVLLNLAVNARDAMQGGGELIIEVANAELDVDYAGRHPGVHAGEYVMFALTDTGCGMPPEVLERAFEPFYTTKPQGQGTGLGLSMAYGFAKQSGGHIRIDSEVGQGTSVRIYLPSSDAPVEEPTNLMPSPVAGGTETILVAEDDVAVRQTVIAMLAALGYRVLSVPNGDDALALLDSDAGKTVDLLFSDVVMPGRLCGWPLRQAVERIRPEIAFLFTSGYPQGVPLDAPEQRDAAALLAKPYMQDDLARALSAIFRERRKKAVRPAVAATVLLVEDDGNTRQSTGELLGILGYEVLLAECAEQALHLLDGHAVSVMITDLELPGMSGTALIDAVAKRAVSPAIIAATGYGGQAGDHGVPANVIVLSKPYDVDALEHAIMTAIDVTSRRRCPAHGPCV